MKLSPACHSVVVELGPQPDSPYGGLLLQPTPGLSPLGVDRDSGLWEFVHLMTGEPPPRGADGRLQIEESRGLVLVLLPDGEVTVRVVEEFVDVGHGCSLRSR